MCPENTTGSTVLHTVNLIVLQHFYDTTNLTVTGKSLMSPENKLTPEGVNWKTYGEKVSNLLAADTSASYSLKKLAESLQNDSTVFHTPAESILSDILHEQSNHKFFGTDLSVLNSWGIGLLIIIAFVFGLLNLRMRRQLTANTTILAKLGVTTALLGTAKGQILKLKTPSTTEWLEPTPVPVIEYIKDDTISFFIMTIMFLSTLILIFSLFYWALKRKSYVYIEIRSAKDVVMINYKRLPDASRCFFIALSSKPKTVTVVNCFLFGFLKFEGKTWKVEDSRTHCRTSLPRRVLLTRGMALKAKQMLLDPACQIGPVVVHTHEQVRRALDLDLAMDAERSALV
jgi:hypothetical protein